MAAVVIDTSGLGGLDGIPVDAGWRELLISLSGLDIDGISADAEEKIHTSIYALSQKALTASLHGCETPRLLPPHYCADPHYRHPSIANSNSKRCVGGLIKRLIFACLLPQRPCCYWSSSNSMSQHHDSHGNSNLCIEAAGRYGADTKRFARRCTSDMMTQHTHRVVIVFLHRMYTL